MYRVLLVIVILTAFAAPALAGNIPCTQAHVNAGFCPTTGHRLFYFAIPNTDPDGVGPRKGMAVEIADAICSPAIGNYQATLEDGAPNPETCADFADKWIKRYFYDKVKQHLANLKLATAASEAEAEVVEEIP